MNKYEEQLKNVWKKVSGGASSYRKPGLSPDLDWLGILGFLAIGFIISAGVGWYIYGAVLSGAFVTVLPSQTSSHTPTLNQNTLQSINDYFTSKASEVTLLQSGTSTPADPAK
jgi:hypothetical protein